MRVREPATERDYDRMVERVKLGRSVGRHPVFAAVIAAELVPGDEVQATRSSAASSQPTSAPTSTRRRPRP